LARDRRIWARVAGRPPRDFQRQKRRNARRCQAITVSGLTRTRLCFQPLQRRRVKAQMARSQRVSGNRVWPARSKTRSWCLRAGISAASAPRERTQVTNAPKRSGLARSGCTSDQNPGQCKSEEICVGIPKVLADERDTVCRNAPDGILARHRCQGQTAGNVSTSPCGAGPASRPAGSPHREPPAGRRSPRPPGSDRSGAPR
jgi:hypothetical protein